MELGEALDCQYNYLHGTVTISLLHASGFASTLLGCF